MAETASALDVVMPEISRALAEGNPLRAYRALRTVLPIGRAGPALLELVSTEPGWRERANGAGPFELHGVDREFFELYGDCVLDGQNLTVRELQVLVGVAEGLTYMETGEILGVGAETVKSHVKRVLLKLGADNMAGAVGIAFRRGIIE